MFFSAFCIWEEAASSQMKQNHEVLSYPLRQFVKFRAFSIRILGNSVPLLNFNRKASDNSSVGFACSKGKTNEQKRVFL